MSQFIRKFSQLTIKDTAIAGGKNAALGEMYTHLRNLGIPVPCGFAITADGYRYFIRQNKLKEKLNDLIDRLTDKNIKEISILARNVFLTSTLPDLLKDEIDKAIEHLQSEYARKITLAVRSSATAEDLPEASFAGQMESFLNVDGNNILHESVIKCFQSLYTERALKYRIDKGFSNKDIAVSVGIQKMVRSDISCSGVAFTLDPDTGFRNAVFINSIYGLGENIVQGRSTPDEFILFKPHINTEFNPIIQKNKGKKEWTMIYADNMTSNEQTENIHTHDFNANLYSISHEDVLTIGKYCVIIEDYFKKPMDIEWAKDGVDGKIYIVQARPETVHALKSKKQFISTYKINGNAEILTQGVALGEKITSGTARVINSTEDGYLLRKGEILVTDSTNPDWDPLLKKAAAIITNRGGRTSHAAIVARELGTVAIVGTSDATEKIKTGDSITVSCVEGKTGKVYKGLIDWKEIKKDISGLKIPYTHPMLILGDPSQAFGLSFLPNRGVGLMRMEFMITHHIKIHPLALTRFNEIKDKEVIEKITELTSDYRDKKEYFTDKLSQGIAVIAAAFHPYDVIVRMSDFKSNEYANLIGGKQFEPDEENPMLGFRGASRYYSPLYKDGFELECKAMKIVRDKMGFRNVKLMIPFCRTIDEAKQVIQIMDEFGLKQGVNGLELYMMVEVPSNILLAEKFAELFDGFSIGSNDLTQLTLGIDRDSSLVNTIFNEKNPAVMQLISDVIKVANHKNVKIGLCGQAPSDFPEYAVFLVEQGINSISFNPDALIKGIENILKAEMKLSKHKIELLTS